MTKEERIVLADIDDRLSKSCYETFVLNRRALRVIHAMMSRPVLPAESSGALLAMADTPGLNIHTAALAYRALEQYLTKKKKVWRVSYCTPEGCQDEASLSSEEDAMEFATKRLRAGCAGVGILTAEVPA